MAAIKLTVDARYVKVLTKRHGLTIGKLQEALEDFLEEALTFDEIDLWLEAHIDDYVEDEEE